MKPPTLAISVVNPSLSNSLIINTCFIILMINLIHVHNVGELSRNYLPYKIMKEFIVVSAHLPAKLVEKVLGKESRTLFIGNNSFIIHGRDQC